MPTRVDSRTDTVSSWTNRRKDLRVIRPAAATAGFFSSTPSATSKTGCLFIDEYIPANVSRRRSKKFLLAAADNLAALKWNQKEKVFYKFLEL